MIIVLCLLFLSLYPCRFPRRRRKPPDTEALRAGRNYIATPVHTEAADKAVLALFKGLRVSDVVDGMDAVGPRRHRHDGPGDPRALARHRELHPPLRRHRRHGPLRPDPAADGRGPDRSRPTTPGPATGTTRARTEVVRRAHPAGHGPRHRGRPDADVGSIGSYNILEWQVARLRRRGHERHGPRHGRDHHPEDPALPAGASAAASGRGGTSSNPSTGPSSAAASWSSPATSSWPTATASWSCPGPRPRPWPSTPARSWTGTRKAGGNSTRRSGSSPTRRSRNSASPRRTRSWPRRRRLRRPSLRRRWPGASGCARSRAASRFSGPKAEKGTSTCFQSAPASNAAS